MLRRTLTAIALVTVCLAAGALSTRDSEAIGLQTVYTVDTISDANLTVCDQFTPGDCSLRGAINDANAHPNSKLFGADSIFFSINPGGIQTITPALPLPAITDAVAIDATGQGSGPDNCGVGIMPCIRLDGANLSSGSSGLKITASATVRGLAIFDSGSGIDIASGTNSRIVGNFIGTGTGTVAAGNTEGVVVDSASNVTIGGTTAPDRNLISGNGTGVLILGSQVVVEGNYIGTTSDGSGALSNKLGVSTSGANVTIGGTDAGSGNLISGNRNGGSGIGVAINDGSALVEGNLIGLNAAGTSAISNDSGVKMLPSGPITMGGTMASARNVISGNDHGVSVSSAGVTMAGNYIGTNAAGDGAVPNGQYGIKLEDAFNAVIGGADAAARNVISGNGGPGILMSGQQTGAPGATVQGNYIGVNAAGTGALANIGAGVLIQTTTAGFGGHDNVVRGNLISGNKGMGIHITGAETAHNTIRDNLIGTDAGGTQPLGNTTPGIGIDGGVPSALIVGNTIGANYIGVDIAQTTTSDIELFTNYVGTNAGLDAGLGNKDVGIHIGAASGITIGGLTAPAAAVEANGPGGAAPGGNVIRNNTYDAIILEGANAVRDRISGNSIDDNGGAGISNQGSNNEQAAPVITSAQNGNGVTHIAGTLTSTPNRTFAVELFVSPACDPSGFGEGRGFEAGVAVNTDGAGLGKIDMGFGPPVAAGSVITATATDSAGDTSDFSNCATVVGATPTPSPSVTPTPTPTHSPTPTPTPSGAAIRGDANCDGKVDTTDALDTLSQTGGVPPGAACPGRADVNCNGQVDADDALRILDYFAGAPRPQPSGCGQIGSPA